MKTLAYVLALSALAGCGGGGAVGATPTADAGADNVYDVTVQVSDGSLTDSQAIAVTVTNQNEAPVITSNGAGATASVSVAENSTAVTTVASTDVDAGTVLSYSITGGVQLLVQNTDGSAISPATCRSWVSRYGITFPELMDPMFITQPFVPMTAFPANVIIDRCGRIRWREYGSENGLTSMRTAIDEVLADPRYPACPTE